MNGEPSRLDMLRSQRETAEKSYNEWLTRLDELHKLPTPYEKNPELLVALRRVNDLVRIPEPPLDETGGKAPAPLPVDIPLPASIELQKYPASIKGRIKDKIRTFVMRLLQIDERFGALEARINWLHRAHAANQASLQEEATRRIEALAERDRELASRIGRENDFRAALIPFLNDTSQAVHDFAVHLQEIEAARIRFFQTVIGMVDTKDREVDGLINNHMQAVFNHLLASDSKLKELIQNRIELLSGRLDVLLEAFDRKLEKMTLQIHDSSVVRDQLHRDLQRAIEHETVLLRDKLQSIRAESKQETSDLSRAIVALKRHLQGLIGAAAPVAVAAAQPAGAEVQDLDDYKYSNFEFRYRGSEKLIRDRFLDYAPRYDGLGPVLDVGCGRGEFLELLADRNVDAYGIDVNDEMVAYCREKGLRAERIGVVEHLQGRADESLGGIFCAQVVEHLEPRYLARFLELAFFRLRKGGVMILETINPTSLYAICEAYYRDLSHVQPVHPDTLKFFVEACGFGDVQVQYLSPVARELKLAGEDENTAKLNRILFGDQDYAIIARKP